MDKAVGMVQVGLGMQVSGRTSWVLGMKGEGRVSSTVWVGQATRREDG